jgi:uncharacterized protein (UPF0548 family)
MNNQQRLAALKGRPLNYDPALPHSEADGWRVDDYCEPLPTEPPGEPLPGGPFERCQTLLREYKVADPKMVVATYDHDSDLVGRDMLLEIRFGPIRLHMGTRIGDVTDETRVEDDRRVRIWGWAYQTLEGHIEQGQMNWEVWKWLDTGEVQFRIHSYSRNAKARNWFVNTGFKLVGQWQRRVYLQHACERMAQMAAEGDRAR